MVYSLQFLSILSYLALISFAISIPPVIRKGYTYIMFNIYNYPPIYYTFVIVSSRIWFVLEGINVADKSIV